MTKHIIAVIGLLALVATARPAAADSKKLVVVVAKGSPITNISRGDLKHAFSGDAVSAGGKTLVPFNFQPGTPERSGFDDAVLGMSADAVGRFWVDRKVRGQSGAPRALPSPAHIAKVVAKFPGAISYLPADALTADVQPVKVDGVAHTDARYSITNK
ncbi:MAG: hypothetical protein K8W52_11790 [Deltaproteobacteria bacterium]|nr:hypothetical protein [Deltaproteobacteria bacterium]